MIFHLSAAEWTGHMVSSFSKCANIFVTAQVCVCVCVYKRENHWVSDRTVCPPFPLNQENDSIKKGNSVISASYWLFLRNIRNPSASLSMHPLHPRRRYLAVKMSSSYWIFSLKSSALFPWVQTQVRGFDMGQNLLFFFFFLYVSCLFLFWQSLK